MSNSNEQAEWVSPDIAARLTARAAVLDAAASEHLSLTGVRSAAIEAGISAEAFDSAVAESRAQGPAIGYRPWWARVCLAGMVDRRAAMVA